MVEVGQEVFAECLEEVAAERTDGPVARKWGVVGSSVGGMAVFVIIVCAAEEVGDGGGTGGEFVGVEGCSVLGEVGGGVCWDWEEFGESGSIATGRDVVVIKSSSSI